MSHGTHAPQTGRPIKFRTTDSSTIREPKVRKRIFEKVKAVGGASYDEPLSRRKKHLVTALDACGGGGHCPLTISVVGSAVNRGITLAGITLAASISIGSAITIGCFGLQGIALRAVVWRSWGETSAGS